MKLLLLLVFTLPFVINVHTVHFENEIFSIHFVCHSDFMIRDTDISYQLNKTQCRLEIYFLPALMLPI
jgi:hypothetical protein